MFIVASLNGSMSADRTMHYYLRKNGTAITTIYTNRTGDRATELSINELHDLVVNDIIDVAIQARDASFVLTYYSGLFRIERARKNTL